MFIDMFHIQMQLMQRQDQWNESVCMYVGTEGTGEFLNQRQQMAGPVESCIICTAFKVLGKSKQGFQDGWLMWLESETREKTY